MQKGQVPLDLFLIGTPPPPKPNMTSWKIHHEWADVFPIEHGDVPASHDEPQKNNLATFHYTGCLMGIFIIPT